MHYCEAYKSRIKLDKFVLRCYLEDSEPVLLYLDKEDVQHLYDTLKTAKRRGEF